MLVQCFSESTVSTKSMYLLGIAIQYFQMHNSTVSALTACKKKKNTLNLHFNKNILKISKIKHRFLWFPFLFFCFVLKRETFSVCYQTDAHSLLLWETAAADPVSLPFIFGGLLSKTPPSDTGPLERGEHASRVRGSEKSPHTLALWTGLDASL